MKAILNEELHWEYSKPKRFKTWVETTMKYTGERTASTIEMNPWDIIDFSEVGILKVERDWEVISEIEWDITSLKII